MKLLKQSGIRTAENQFGRFKPYIIKTIQTELFLSLVGQD